MKLAYKLGLATGTLWSAFTLVGAYMAWQINPADWDINLRIGVALTAATLNVILCGVLLETHEP